jgi:hypothetical protein
MFSVERAYRLLMNPWDACGLVTRLALWLPQFLL